jgi:hypothetical protein
MRLLFVAVFCLMVATSALGQTVIDITDMPYSITSNGVYQIDTSGGFDYSSTSWMIQLGFGLTDVVIEPYNGLYQDTITLSGSAEQMLRFYSPVTFQGFIIESATNVAQIRSMGFPGTIQDLRGGCYSISFGPDGTSPVYTPSAVVIQRVRIDCGTVGSERLIGISGKIDTSEECGYSLPDNAGTRYFHQRTTTLVDGVTISDVQIKHDVKNDTSENYTLGMTACTDVLIEDLKLTINSTPHGAANNVTGLQLIAFKDFLLKDIEVQATGDRMEQLFEMRGHTDAIAYDNTLGVYFACDTDDTIGGYLRDIYLNSPTTGDGLSIDGYNVNTDGLRSFVAGTGNRGQFRTTEKGYNVNLSDGLLVATQALGRGVVMEHSDFHDGTVGDHKVRNTTIITQNAPTIKIEGHMAGDTKIDNNILVRTAGTEEVVEIENGTPDILSMRNNVLVGPDSDRVLKIVGAYKTLAELEDGTYPPSANNAWVTSQLFVSITSDSTGTFTLSNASTAINFGSNVLIAPYDTELLDVFGETRVQGSSVDAGAAEYPSVESGGTVRRGMSGVSDELGGVAGSGGTP